MEKFVAVNFGTGPAGFCGEDIGEFLAFIKQEIPQPVKQSRALGKAGLLPSPLGLAPSTNRQGHVRGLGYRQFGNLLQRRRIADDEGLRAHSFLLKPKEFCSMMSAPIRRIALRSPLLTPSFGRRKC